MLRHYPSQTASNHSYRTFHCQSKSALYMIDLLEDTDGSLSQDYPGKILSPSPLLWEREGGCNSYLIWGDFFPITNCYGFENLQLTANKRETCATCTRRRRETPIPNTSSRCGHNRFRELWECFFHESAALARASVPSRCRSLQVLSRGSRCRNTHEEWWLRAL